MRSISLLFSCLLATVVLAQDKVYYQQQFSKKEFERRRNVIYDHVGTTGFAVLQGARDVDDFGVFRQTNSFYYLSGIEIPHAYLLLDGRSRRTTLYIPYRDAGRERGEGKILSAEDKDLIIELSGIDQVKGIDYLSRDLVGRGLVKPPASTLYTPFSPAETGTDSRDVILGGQARISSDPWDGAPSRESRFIGLLNERFPQFPVKDLTPILDEMRLIKSKEEIEVIRRATQIAGLAIMEAMRSSEPGVYEYQLDAAAKFVFYENDAQNEGYASIIGGGTNAWMGHYFHKKDVLKDGDMVLMDYAPDYKYYTSDVTRMWPVNGKHTKSQRQLAEYIIAYKDALFRYIKPGVTADEVLDNAARDMEEYLKDKEFEKEIYRKAVEQGLKFRGHFQHPVGMAVHDVGRVRGTPLKAGMVFTIDPMIWIPEEKLYIRMEDMALVTETGVENLSEFVPADVDEIEKLMKEKGLVQHHPPIKNK